MILPLGYQQVELRPLRIIFTMSSTPTVFNITNTTMRYDKDFAFSFRLDDGYLDAYTAAFPFFNGGDVIYNGGSINDYPGLNFTDGCGNDVKFKCEMAINSESVELVPSPTNRMNWVMINELYNEGWGMWNHGANEIVSPAFDGLTQPEIDAIVATEIDTGEAGILNNTSVRCRNFTAPSNDNNYDPLTIQRADSGLLKIVNNIRSPQRDAYLETYQFWYTTGGGRINGIGADYDFINVNESANLQLDNTDLDFITTTLAGLGASENAWFANGIHRCGFGDGETPDPVSIKFNEMRDFFERVESTYGKSGNDTIWFAPQNEIYEYQFTSELAQLSTSIDGTTVTVTVNFGEVPSTFREHALSLNIDSDVNITNITYENFDSSSHNIGFYGDNTTALVNVGSVPEYEGAVISRGRAEVLVTRAETTRVQSDFDAAQAFVTALSNGSYKDSQQARLDAIIVVPDSTVWFIDFGTNTTGSETAAPFNNFTSQDQGLTVGSTLSSLIDSLSNITTLEIEIITAFSALETNSRADVGNVNNPFPYEALRDSFETPGTGVSEFRLNNLDPTKLYDFTATASRGFTDSDTTYTFTGSNSGSDTITTRDNGLGDVWVVATVNNISPNGSNQIVITVEGAGNDEGYIGALQITEKNP